MKIDKKTSKANVEEGVGDDEADNYFLVENFEGTVEDRHCTDLFSLLLIIMSWVSMVAIGLAALGYIRSPYIRKGDPQRLLRGVDYQGNICGVDTAVIGLDKLWYPNAGGIFVNSLRDLVPSDFGVCVATCPVSGDVRTDPYGVHGPWGSALTTYDIVGYCRSLDLKKGQHLASDMLGDFLRSMTVVAVAGFLLAAVASLLFLFVIRIPFILRTVVWVSITMVFILLAAGGYAFITQAKQDEVASAGSDALQSKAQVPVTQ
jgi:hypothetical protein